MAKKAKKKPKKGEKGYKAPNKFTHGRVMNWLSILGPGIRSGLGYVDRGDEGWLYAIGRQYTGMNFDGNEIGLAEDATGELTRGYASIPMRALENKLFKVLHISGPRASLKNYGDVLDLLTYHGAAFMQLVDDLETDKEMHEVYQNFHRIEFGVSLDKRGFDTIDPEDYIYLKLAPYILQRGIRKVARKFGVTT